MNHRSPSGRDFGPYSVAQLKETDQDLIKRSLLVYYEQCIDAFKQSIPDPEDRPTELELTMIEIAFMYAQLTGRDINAPDSEA